MHAIELTNLYLTRGGREILRGINWSVPYGTCAAILGPNGSGKSTLTRIISGHLWPTGGDVSVLGQSFGETSLPELRESIRLVQAAGPYDVEPELTATEVVLTGLFGSRGLYHDVSPRQRDDAMHLLKFVGLSRVTDASYATLSSGERVRALIARAMIRKPRMLLLDEPTAGLDLRAREEVLATVQNLITRDPSPPTVVFITHHVEELPPATSQVLVLDDGAVAAAGSPIETLRADVLSRVYRCEVEVSTRNGRFYLHVSPGAWENLLHRE